MANFYERLYTASNYDDSHDQIFLTNLVPKITEDERMLCENEINLNELTTCLRKMKLNKTPGTDGLTVEFYLYFWDDIKILVHESLIYALQCKRLSCDQKRGILRLIPKKGKDLTHIKNWRPISLLNTDYKILAHVLSNRLQSVLPNIISIDQSGYIKNRSISTNIRSIFDVIDHVENNNLSSLLVFIDFEKAFDKLNWTFIQKALKQFGFGPILREWVQILYTDIESCIINNGVTTKYFKIKSGIRQGCPLSALLFVIAVELLTISIKNNNLIKGFKLGNKTFKITQLADDTTLFLNDIPSLKEALNLLTKFKNTSGLKLNESKTEVLQIGIPLTLNYSLYKLRWEKERIYALGTWFYKDNKSSIKHTYEDRLELLATILNSWSRRKLTWLGKITVLKTMCISKINYAISTIETPDWFIERAKSLFNTFLWGGKPARIKINVMCNDYPNGGLRMTNLNQYIKAQKISCIKRLLTNKETIPYACVSHFIDMPIEHYLKCSLNNQCLPELMPAFYKNILREWFALKEDPQNVADVQREVIWNNRSIKIDNKSIFYRKLYHRGMVFINDIINEHGNFISYQTLIDRFGKFISEYDYLSLKHAIPVKWKRILDVNETYQLNPNAEAIFFTSQNIKKPLSILKSKEIYWILNTEQTTAPTCQQKWFEKYYIDFSDRKWSDIFLLTKSLTLNTKLIEFQFKIIHRVFATDSYVSNFDVSVNKKCKDCHVDNNIPHLFVDCAKIKLFWIGINDRLSNLNEPIQVLSTIDIIFGIPKCAAFALNFIILHAKWFIHLQRKEDFVDIRKFWLYIKNVLIVEKEIAVGRNNLVFFNKFMQPLVDIVIPIH